MDFFRRSSGFQVENGSFNAAQGHVFHNTYNSSKHAPSAHNTTNCGEIHNHFHYHVASRKNRRRKTSRGLGKGAKDTGWTFPSQNRAQETVYHPCALCERHPDALRELGLVMEYESALRHLIKARDEWTWTSKAI
ncbi:hypothetical protein PQX77_009523 [Marasmius sp. AFHP31]|nr:hypothetical protein PQX77_009523 [Marasmius sp. AFHP31]